MISKSLRLSDRTLTSSSSEEMPRLGVGLSQDRCIQREHRGRQGALRVTARPQPGGRTAPELRPGECTAGPGRCGTSRSRGEGPGGARGWRLCSQTLVLYRRVFSARLLFKPSSRSRSARPPALFPRLPLHPRQVLRLRMGAAGWVRGGFPEESSSVGTGSWLQAGLGIPRLESSSSLCGQALGEAPPYLGLSFSEVCGMG